MGGPELNVSPILVVKKHEILYQYKLVKNSGINWKQIAREEVPHEIGIMC